jgi:hypothetical protein
MRLCWILIVAVTVLLSLSTARPASGEQRYTATLLRGTLAAATAYGLNDFGDVVGATHSGSVPFDQSLVLGSTRPMLWTRDGQAIELPMPANPDARTAIFNDVNNAGALIGEFRVRASPISNFARIIPWRKDGAAESYLDGAFSATATRISNDGVAVARGLLWDGVSTVSVVQPTAPAQVGVGAISSDSTQLTGSIIEMQPTNGYGKAARVFTDRPPELLDSQGRYGYAAAITNSGYAVGVIAAGSDAESAARAAVYSGGIASPITLPATHDGRSSALRRVNDRGDAIGWFSRLVTVFGTTQASIFFPLLHRDHQTFDLGTLIDGVDLTSITALDINNRGQIVIHGFADHDGNPSTARVGGAYRLDPIRHPGDATTDGTTNFDDLLLLAANYNRSGNGSVFYETGDFNYDWRVDFDDLLILAANYNTTAAGSPNAALAVSIPEPTGVLFTSPAMFGLLHRRRRS